MTDATPVWILLTTYRRTSEALQTVRAIKENLQWGNLGFYVADDDSPTEHVKAIFDEIGPEYAIRFYNSRRRGVGHSMNYCLQYIFNNLSPLALVAEDDWVLHSPLDLAPYVHTLMNHVEHSHIRFGYLSPNLLGYLISEEGKLFWRIEENLETYRAVGHPRLLHARFHNFYGWYDEGLAPGMSELSLAGKVNQKMGGPTILYPAECGAYGFFHHIGSVSLADTEPQG